MKCYGKEDGRVKAEKGKRRKIKGKRKCKGRQKGRRKLVHEEKIVAEKKMDRK